MYTLSELRIAECGFFFMPRYLFSWFGFKASEFLC
jgi:hypothetical protein